MPYKDRETRLAYHRAKYAAHRESALEEKRAYYQANKEALKAQHKAHHERNREAMLSTMRAYYANRRATQMDKARAYRKANPDKVAAMGRAYRLANPDVMKAHWQRYRARKHAAPKNDLSAAQWREIKDAYGHRCVYCGKQQQRLTMDHIQPISKGGAHTASNIVPACQSCNSRKQDRAPLSPVQPLLLTIAPSRR